MQACVLDQAWRYLRLSLFLTSGEEDVARVARGVQREAQLERGGRVQGARRHARHDRQRAGHRRRADRDQEEALPRVLRNHTQTHSQSRHLPKE